MITINTNRGFKVGPFKSRSHAEDYRDENHTKGTVRMIGKTGMTSRGRIANRTFWIYVRDTKLVEDRAVRRWPRIEALIERLEADPQLIHK